MRESWILGLCLFLSTEPSSCPQTSFHQCHRRSPGAPKLFQIFVCARESSSRVSSFPFLKIDTPPKKKRKGERAGWRRRWLFSTVLVIFLAFLLPSDNICVNSRQFYYKPTQLEGSGRGKKGQSLRESCIVSAVVSHKERLLFEVVSTDFKSLLLWWR